ncbi:hypothetical protein KCM76_02495 [Zooshikella marina]|uniref:hypothetical protein n=1 Tax=Zooshikella ganghwensis TaxID=202772 RepID=UPI001BB0BE46|nr:hypothetical protein [Zooshikella ganghwensis]MBU2704831.1 hypothetical protein [Zooshikella ganghwensis]
MTKVKNFKDEYFYDLELSGEGLFSGRLLQGSDALLMSAIKQTHHPIFLTHQELIIHGQGTIAFTFQANTSFGIVLSENTAILGADEPVVCLEIGFHQTVFKKKLSDDSDAIIALIEKPCNTDAFLDINRVQTYWLSIDKENRLLRFGKGYMLHKLVLFEAELPRSGEAEEDAYAYIEKLKFISLMGDFTQEILSTINSSFWKFPVTVDLPPVVTSSNEVTLDMLDQGTSTVINNLFEECGVLYGNVAGQRVVLNTPDFPGFADAINYSIITKGCMLYEKLKEKKGEFGHSDLNETYLRITVGVNKGNSPGVPFVLEIWPGGHYSPIHNHSNCNAIIKVLHGSIQCNWYRGLSAYEKEPYDFCELKKDEVTWLNSRQFQTHKLHNINPKGEMCATIQCYMYDTNDIHHYEYFDYIDADDTLQHFTPNSDWEFGEFKVELKKEWNSRLL